VLHDEEFFIELYDHFRKANSLVGSVGYWNDQNTRTKEQVLEAFDRAIDFGE